MRKTTIWLEDEDDQQIEKIKKATKVLPDIAAIRYALHNCRLPRKK